MAYIKRTWKGRESEFPDRRILVPTGNPNEYIIVRSEGIVTADGDLITDDAMNDLEERIAHAFDGAGSQFVVLGHYASLSALQTAHATGTSGDAYSVGQTVPYDVYVWGVDAQAWQDVGPISGPQGPQGESGTAATIQVGTVTTGEPGTQASVANSGTESAATFDFTIPRGEKGEAGAAGPTGAQGVQGEQGPQGIQGEKGDKGDDGASFKVLGLYATPEDLQAAHPSGSEGDAYAVGTEAENVIYLWDTDDSAWTNIGPLQGPQGIQGPKGDTGDTGPQGPKGDQGETGPAGPGILPGGAAGQTLKKMSGTDYDAEWATLTLDDILDGETRKLSDVPTPNYAGKLIVHVVAEDGGSVAGTRVRIRNEQLGSNYVQSLDALGNTTFSLLDNHVYYVVLLDYPSAYFGAAATVAIAGGETQDLTLTLKTEPDIVGFKIDVATREVTYTDGAESFEPMSMTDGALSAGSWEGHWAADIKPCLLKNMVVQYYLAKTGVLLYDYEHQANGTASDIRSGDDGDVMNEVPLEYYKFWSETTPDGHTYRHFQLAKEPQDDTWCCNAFLSNSGVVQDAVYLPAYKGTIYNGKLRSLCGVAPTVSQTISAFRTAANAGGAGYGIRDLSKDRFLAALYILLFKSLNGQADLGKGVTSASAAVASGTLNEKPLFWGDQTGTNGVKFAGIEHFWGNVYDFLDGIVQIDNVYHYKIYGPYNDGGDGYLSGPTIPSTGYIDDMDFSNGYGMVPSVTVSAEADSGYHDYSYNGGSGTHIQYVGGTWSGGLNAGPFCWIGGTASSLSPGIGASLFATPQQ